MKSGTGQYLGVGVGRRTARGPRAASWAGQANRHPWQRPGLQSSPNSTRMDSAAGALSSVPKRAWTTPSAARRVRKRRNRVLVTTAGVMPARWQQLQAVAIEGVKALERFTIAQQSTSHRRSARRPRPRTTTRTRLRLGQCGRIKHGSRLHQIDLGPHQVVAESRAPHNTPRASSTSTLEIRRSSIRPAAFWQPAHGG
jgi:hypothetical protein